MIKYSESNKTETERDNDTDTEEDVSQKTGVKSQI